MANKKKTNKDFKYGTKNVEYVKLDVEKLFATFKKKKLTKAEVCKAVGIGTTYFNDVNRRPDHKCNKEVFNAICKTFNLRPSYYIIADGLKRNNIPVNINEKEKEKTKKTVTKKKVSKKEAPIIHRDTVERQDKNELIITGKEPVFADTPLVVHLKSKNEFDELIQVQKDIRDALRELVKELKTPSCVQKPTTIDLRPKAYLMKGEKDDKKQ